MTPTNERGFTLIEILMTVVLIGTLAVVSISYYGEDINEQRYDATVSELETIRAAMIGDERLTSDGKRVSYGFVGDIGSVPSTLDDLYDSTGFTAQTVDATSFIRHGYGGPYLTDSSGENSILSDGWGRGYTYSSGTDPVTVTSLGADGLAGGSGLDSDITLSIPRSLFLSTVKGVVTSDGAPYLNNAEILIYYPNGTNGSITSSSTTITAASSGLFSFNNIPIGIRSVKVFVPSVAAATKTIGPVSINVDKAQFQIPNAATSLTSSSGVCTVNAATTLTGTPTLSANGRTLSFNYFVNSSVTYTSASVNWSNSATLNSINLNGDTDAAGTLRGVTFTITHGPTTVSGTAYSGQLNFGSDIRSGAPSPQPISILLIESGGGCSLFYFNVT